jgi:preprotein translocase subunit Sec63
MHVLLTAVTEILVCAYIFQRTVTITTHVPKILATPEPENVSLKISLLKSPQLALTDVSSQNVIQLKDLFKLHLSANLQTNVPRLSVIQQEDVSPHQSFVTNLQEELSTNVTQPTEFANV